MLLYRIGVLGFLVVMAPFAWVPWRIFRLWRSRPGWCRTLAGRLQVAAGLSTVALLAASWLNPYFASVMTPLFVAMFVALDDFSWRTRTRRARAVPGVDG